jgi:hypothetical protein
MLRILQILACLLFLPSVIFSQSVKLSGHVTGSDTSAVSGATISVVGTTYGTVTDKSGYFKINKIEPGTYIIRASFVGFETEEQTIDIHNDNYKLNFSLK